MNGTGRIAANAAGLVAGRLLAKAVLVVAGFWVARHLGAHGLGEYAYAMAYVVFFEFLATIGLPPLLARECAARPAETPEILGRALALWTRAAVACPFVVVLPSIALGHDAETTKEVVVASIGLLLWSLGSIHNAVLVAQERMGRVAAIEAATAAVRAALCVGAILLHASVTAFLACYTLSQAFFHVVSWASCPVRPSRPLRGHPADLALGPLLRQALPFALMFLASGIYFRADVVILRSLRGPEETGIYEAAWRPVNEVLTLGQLVAMSFLPRLSALFGSDRGAYVRLARTAVWTMVALGLPAAAIGHLYAAPLILICYGPAFAASAPVLGLVALDAAVYFPACALTYALVASGRTWVWPLALGLKGGVAIALHLALVPRFGAVGTGMAMLLSDLVATVPLLAASLAIAPRLTRA